MKSMLIMTKYILLLLSAAPLLFLPEPILYAIRDMAQHLACKQLVVWYVVENIFTHFVLIFSFNSCTLMRFCCHSELRVCVVLGHAAH